MELFYVVTIAAIFGLFTGLLPGIGSSALMLTSLPLLYALPPEVCIVFYAVGVQASQFSGSVSAINFGMMGELTSYPALAERQHILANGLQKTALKFTAIGSIISCIIPIISLYPLLIWFQQHSVMMRSDFTMLVILIIIVCCIFFKTNPRSINFFMILIGILISQIGLESQGSSERNLLTFDQTWLYGGIPMISILGGLIAIPLIMRYINWEEKLDIVNVDAKKEKKIKFPLFSALRGGMLGLFTGLIPAIGTQVGSNIAWLIEKKFYIKQNDQSVMSRLTSAESANNASQVMVLIPLLTLGIAIVPSEMILLGVIETKYWIPGQSDWLVMGLGLNSWLAISLIASSIFCYLMCYSFVSGISKWIGKNLNLLNKICILVMAAAVVYAGSLVEARTFFLMSFVVFSLVGVIFKKLDFIPLVAGYFIGDIFMDTAEVLQFLYD